jgi:hypothetical protein
MAAHLETVSSHRPLAAPAACKDTFVRVATKLRTLVNMWARPKVCTSIPSIIRERAKAPVGWVRLQSGVENHLPNPQKLQLV